MDVLVRLDIDVTNFRSSRRGLGCEIRRFTDGDLPTLREIARTAFSSGHFRSDGRFDQRKVDGMYALWLDKCVKEHYEFAVAVNDHEPVGFVAARNQGHSGDIELVAVSQTMRSKGVGYEMMSYYLEAARQRHQKVEIGVHLDNTAALRLYGRLGFAVRYGELTFHRWNEP